MRIIREDNSRLKQKNSPDFISNIIKRIFLICKNDKHFKLKDQTKGIEFRLEGFQKKVDNQNKLIRQADGLYKDVKKRIDILNSENSDLKTTLIESLGGSI